TSLAIAEPLAHYREGGRTGIDQHEAPSQLPAHRAERARAGKWIQAPPARSRGGRYTALYDPLGLLRRIAGLLATVGGDDRVEPNVGRPLAPACLLDAHQPRSHVRLSFYRLGVEVVGARSADVHENRVVLGRPAPTRLAAVVVAPDDLVEERLSPEDVVQEQL